MKKSLALFFFLISLGLQAQIQLKITDQISGVPLENVRVKSGKERILRTNSSGIIALPADGPTRISLALEGYESLEKDFTPGEYEVKLNPTILKRPNSHRPSIRDGPLNHSLRFSRCISDKLTIWSVIAA
jgi:iron complex outermembrane receptor protein